MQKTMKAVVYHGKQDIRFEDRPIPTILHPKDAIVKVQLSSICTSDLHILHGTVPRAKPGVILGHEFVGTIVAIGNDITTLSVGERVAANVETFCGNCFYCKKGYVNNCIHGGWELGCRIDGCQTEYVRVPYAENGLSHIPDSLSYEDVLLVGDVLSSGYFGAQLAEINPSDTVVVIGAGPVGLAAMMCARLFGPAKIIATDIMDSRLALAKKQGWADITLNPEKENVEELVKTLTNGRGADAVIEAAGGKSTFQDAWKVARPNAIVALIAMYEEAQSLPLPDMYGKNLIFKTGGVDAFYCAELIQLIEYGKINCTPLLTHRRPLNDIKKIYEMFENNEDDVIKFAITPFE